MKSFFRFLWHSLLVILCGIFLGVFIFAGYQLYQTFYGYHAAQKEYENLNQQFVNASVSMVFSPSTPVQATS